MCVTEEPEYMYYKLVWNILSTFWRHQLLCWKWWHRQNKRTQ